jgi:hypothetical protein
LRRGRPRSASGGANAAGWPSILAEVGRKLKTSNKSRILELEQDFHVVILEASGNRTLAEMGCGILDRIWIIQNINLLTTSHLSEAHPQHLEVFHAIERGDAEHAAELMKKHITFAKEFVLSRLRRTDDVLSQILGGFPAWGGGSLKPETSASEILLQRCSGPLKRRHWRKPYEGQRRRAGGPRAFGAGAVRGPGRRPRTRS